MTAATTRSRSSSKRPTSLSPLAGRGNFAAIEDENHERHAGDAQRQQELFRCAGAARRQLLGRGRPDPRPGRRERRRQIDADEGAERCLPGWQLRRDHRLRRRGAPLPRHQRFRGARYHHHPPGTGADPADVDRGKHLPVASAVEVRRDRSRRGLPAHARSACAGRAQGIAGYADHRSRRRQAAAGRDRQGAVQAGAHADPGRADREPERGRQRRAARTPDEIPRAGHRLDPDLAQAQRGRQGRRPHHRAARWPHRRRHRLPRRADPGRPHHPQHGRPRSRPSLPRAQR